MSTFVPELVNFSTESRRGASGFGTWRTRDCRRLRESSTGLRRDGLRQSNRPAAQGQRAVMALVSFLLPPACGPFANRHRCPPWGGCGRPRLDNCLALNRRNGNPHLPHKCGDRRLDTQADYTGSAVLVNPLFLGTGNDGEEPHALGIPRLRPVARGLRRRLFDLWGCLPQGLGRHGSV